MTGAQIANGFSSAVQAAGIGYAIGSVISDAMQDAGQKVADDITNAENRFSGRGMGKEIGNLDLSTPEGIAKARALRSEINRGKARVKSQAEFSLSNMWSSGLSMMAGGQSTWEAAGEQAKALRGLSDALHDKIVQEVQVKVELTGAAAGQAEVKSITKKSGKGGSPSAPSVNKGKAGSQR
jgi:hypothetical protein